MDRKLLMTIAEEMYNEGVTRSESYSDRSWEMHGWPPVEDDSIYLMIDYYLKFLHATKEYFEDGKDIKTRRMFGFVERT